MTAQARRRIVLHVGSPKTGTTFLQQVLWSHREQVAGQGVTLPLQRFHDHYLAALDVRDVPERPDAAHAHKGVWERLVAATAEAPGTVVVSHELFAPATPEQARAAVADLAEHGDVHVVVTARDLVRQIPAEWQEHIKHRYRKRLPRFVRSLRRDTEGRTWFWQVQDYAAILERWGADLPPDQRHLVTVPRAGAPQDLLWSRFATVIGLQPEPFPLGGARTNTSLGWEQAELLRRVNKALGDRLPLPGPYAPVVKEHFAQRILAARPGTRLQLDKNDTAFALERSAEIVDRLRRLGVNVVGDLDDLVPDPAATLAAAPAAYPDVPADVVLGEAVGALAALLNDPAHRRAQHRYEQLAAELRRRPLRTALIQASELNPTLRRARQVYQWRHGLRRHRS